MPVTPYLESRALSKSKYESTGQRSQCTNSLIYASSSNPGLWLVEIQAAYHLGASTQLIYIDD